MDAFDDVDEIGEFLRYRGSLTYPPCTEDYTWYIWLSSQKMSEEQLLSFSDLWMGNNEFAEGKGNNRNVQPLGDRVVYYFNGDDSDQGFILTLGVILLTILG